MPRGFASRSRHPTRRSIDNLEHAVTLDDGRCVPSLKSLGVANPFYGATAAGVRAYRASNMHGPGDHEFAFVYPKGFAAADGMDPISIVQTLGPAQLIQKQPAKDFTSIAASPHAPNNGHHFKVAKVARGGSECTNPIKVDLSLPIAGRYAAGFVLGPNVFLPEPQLVTRCLGKLKTAGATNVYNGVPDGAPSVQFDITTKAQRDAVTAMPDCFSEVYLLEPRD